MSLNETILKSAVKASKGNCNEEYLYSFVSGKLSFQEAAIIRIARGLMTDSSRECFDRLVKGIIGLDSNTSLD